MYRGHVEIHPQEDLSAPDIQLVNVPYHSFVLRQRMPLDHGIGNGNRPVPKHVGIAAKLVVIPAVNHHLGKRKIVVQYRLYHE